jgi:adenine-specific DNA-methyltransferase
LHAAGEYEEAGSTRRVAVSIGPQYGTVDERWVRDAALEASHDAFDLLVICGLAFDGYLGSGFRQFGNLPIMRAAMNPDILMGEDLLKDTPAANMFTVFGEPDVSVNRGRDGWVVEIHGVDVYDPTSGEIRSHSVDDIACWFIDTAYNGESFFIRHAYFLGAHDPYATLKKLLRADIDEATWASLYSTKSRPFRDPATGRIAVKVINHYGDGVVKVYETAEVPAE